LRFRPVFTPVGCVVLFASLFILIRSLMSRNAYEIVIACFILLSLLITGIIGLWKSIKLKSMEAGWKSPFPLTALIGNEKSLQSTIITGLESNIPFFFRLHFFIKGRFFPSGSKNSCGMSAETSVPRGETSANIKLDFPMSGIFRGEGFCQLRDIFGFYSFYCGNSQQSTLNVRAAPCFGKKTLINAQAGAEDQRNKPSADVERYYMREYTPGDRFRDINWKSSDKIDTLITRISTDNQEKISRIDVYFRNFCAASSLEALWFLDRAKARLAYFLRSLMDSNASLIFDVRSAEKEWEIEDHDDLDEFLEELAGISFVLSRNESAISQKTGDIYVFSTACDTGLQSFLISCNPRPVTLFMIQPGNSNDNEIEILQSNDFISKGINFNPNSFKSGNVKQLNVNANKTDVFYAEIKL